jgi:putative phosphoserine phosphatase/1-acylglycerol-3-phosphate O-acyltransferase
VPTPSPELATRLATVHAAPADGVAVVDESALLDRSLAAAFASEALRAGRTSWRALPAEVALVAGASGDGGVDAVHRLVASWTGEDTATLERRARTLFREEVAAYLRPEMWALVAAHQRRGHRVVITGQSTRFQLAPLAADLDADDVVATEVELRDDVATGRVTGPVLYGPDKAAALARTLGGRSADFAYAGSAADAEVLGAAVRPMVVGRRGGSPSATTGRSCPPRPAGDPCPTRPTSRAPPRCTPGCSACSPRAPGSGSRVARVDGWSTWCAAPAATSDSRSPGSTSRSPARSTSGRRGRPCSCSTTRARSTSC